MPGVPPEPADVAVPPTDVSPLSTANTSLTRGLRWGVVCLAGLAVLLGFYWSTRELVRHEMKSSMNRAIAVVDLEQALALQRASYLKIMADEKASEDDKAAATTFIKSSADRINHALAQIAQECDCILLIRPAVLQYRNAGLADHTPRLLDLVSVQVARAAGQDGR